MRPPLHRFRIPGSVVYQALNGEGELVNLADGRFYVLDELGVRAWTLVGTTGDVRLVERALLADSHAAAEQIAARLEAFVATLVRRGLIEPSA
jgi:hypothetical protein